MYTNNSQLAAGVINDVAAQNALLVLPGNIPAILLKAYEAIQQSGRWTKDAYVLALSASTKTTPANYIIGALTTYVRLRYGITAPAVPAPPKKEVVTVQTLKLATPEPVKVLQLTPAAPLQKASAAAVVRARTTRYVQSVEAFRAVPAARLFTKQVVSTAVDAEPAPVEKKSLVGPALAAAAAIGGFFFLNN